MVNPSLLESIFRLIFFLSSLRDFEQYLTFFEGKNSSLNYNIWRSFCSFWYSQTYQQESSFLFMTSLLDLHTHRKVESNQENNRVQFSRDIILRNVCVGDKGTMCQRENGVRGVFSLSFFFLTVYDVTKKLYLAGIWSTIQKRAKRTPDIIVETTLIIFSFQFTRLQPLGQ